MLSQYREQLGECSHLNILYDHTQMHPKALKLQQRQENANVKATPYFQMTQNEMHAHTKSGVSNCTSMHFI